MHLHLKKFFQHILAYIWYRESIKKGLLKVCPTIVEKVYFAWSLLSLQKKLHHHFVWEPILFSSEGSFPHIALCWLGNGDMVLYMWTWCSYLRTLDFSDFTEHGNFSGKLKIKSKYCLEFLLSQILLIFGTLYSKIFRRNILIIWSKN